MTQGILVLGKRYMVRSSPWNPDSGSLTNLIDLSQDAVANIRSAWSKVTQETAFVWSFQGSPDTPIQTKDWTILNSL